MKGQTAGQLSAQRFAVRAGRQALSGDFWFLGFWVFTRLSAARTGWFLVALTEQPPDVPEPAPNKAAALLWAKKKAR